MNITKEKKLLDLFNALDDTRKDALIMCAEIMSKYADPVAETPAPVPVPAPAPAPDPVDVQTSIRQSKLIRTAEKASHHIPLRYQLTTSDFDALYSMVKDDAYHDPFYAICRTFEYGFVMGNRATRRGVVKAL